MSAKEVAGQPAGEPAPREPPVAPAGVKSGQGELINVISVFLDRVPRGVLEDIYKAVGGDLQKIQVITVNELPKLKPRRVWDINPVSGVEILHTVWYYRKSALVEAYLSDADGKNYVTIYFTKKFFAKLLKETLELEFINNLFNQIDVATTELIRAGKALDVNGVANESTLSLLWDAVARLQDVLAQLQKRIIRG